MSTRPHAASCPPDRVLAAVLAEPNARRARPGRASRRLAALVGALAATSSVAPAARAQERYLAEPTAGVALPGSPLAGDQDATAVALDPGGLVFLRGTHLELAYTRAATDGIDQLGDGLGLYLATPITLPFLPRFGVGMAIERVSPPADAILPTPGEPVRFSLAGAWALGPWLGAGFAWRHFFDDIGRVDGVDTLDLGLSARLGRAWAVGLAVRDLTTPVIDGTPAQRRYEAELVSRPLGDDRLELALGVALGETRREVEPRARAAVRLADGLVLRAAAEAQTRWRLDDPMDPRGPVTARSTLVASLGLEVSFGSTGVTAWGTGAVAQGGERTFGGTGIVRWSGERLPSILPGPRRIERIRVEGGLDERELTALLIRLHRASRDRELAGVFLDLDGVPGGWATAQELREALALLRARGKKVLAYLVAGGTREYYVAAAADRIYLDAGGGLRLQGVSSTLLFFKELFDQIGVSAQFEKIAEYKSAPETFTREASSGAAREMRESILDDVYRQVVADLARDRGLTQAQVRRLIDEGPYTAVEAGRVRLVDAVVEPTDLEDLVRQVVGGGVVVGQSRPERAKSWGYPGLAIVYLDGDIVDGRSVDVPVVNRRMVGGDTIAEAIAWARESPAIAAIVIRIDSPGGSVLASEKIAREVARTRGSKPIVVSMGGVAASGGYFAAAPADVIFAAPGTLTGSIGIYVGKFDVSALLRRLGVTWETTSRGAKADLDSYLRPYTPEERSDIQDKLRYYYDRFLRAVARGRGLTVAQVDAVGRGRVWTGAQARARRLVDRMGGLSVAIVEAKRRAGLGEEDPAEVVMLPLRPRSVVAQLLQLAGGEADGAAAVVPPIARELLQALPGSVLMGRSGDVQARLEFGWLWN